jgi:ParB/RepB/Spo0J family partition protein
MTDVIDTVSLESSAAAAVSHAKPALEFVSLNVIDFAPQVRSESGLDEESLQELAESVQANGILQPVLLRPNGGRFIVIAGERRCRAAHLAGFSHVPALIGEADDGRAAAMQLIENVQRVDLSLLEIAAALRKLADEGKTLTEISQIVRKSKPWVSKHLAASIEKLGYYTKWWMEREGCEDLETVLCMHQIEKAGKWHPRGMDLAGRISEGLAGRAEARELLAAVKEEVAAEVADKKAAKKKAAEQGALELGGSGGNQEKEAPVWSASQAIRDLHEALEEEGHAPIAELTASMTKVQQLEVANIHKSDWTAGKLLSKATEVQKLRGLHHLIDENYGVDEWATAAFILGSSGNKLTLAELVAEVHQVMHG